MNIYKITSPATDSIYIGSTKGQLSSRFSNHKYNYKKWIDKLLPYKSSFEILKYPDSKIELLEKFECDTRAELCKREGYYININKNICVNKNMAGRLKYDKINCDCGLSLSATNYSRHIRNSNRHRNYYLANPPYG